jgi:hypothetical protein
MSELSTDYMPGDEPVPKGSVVEYFGSHKHGRYIVVGHREPMRHPGPPPHSFEELTEAYPDGVTYDIWPEDLPVKFGFRDYAVYFVRRTSFRVVSRPENP